MLWLCYNVVEEIDFMNRIKQLRKEFGFTQQELANKLKCSKSIIGLYESELRKPSMEILLKLSSIFECNIDYLLGVSNVRSIHDLDDLDIAFSNGIKGLNDENRETLKNIMKGLLLKQHMEEQSKTNEKE